MVDHPRPKDKRARIAALLADLLGELLPDEPAAPVRVDALEPVATLEPAELRTPVRKAIKLGELSGVRVGRGFVVKRADLDAWIAARAVTPTGPRRRARTAAPANDLDAEAAELASMGIALRRAGGAR